MTVLTGAAGLLAALLVLAVVTVSVATAAWRRETTRRVHALRAGIRASEERGDRTARMAVEVLPPVVRHYLERSGALRSRPVAWATLHQEGWFQMSRGEAGWRPFSATQSVRAYPPGFVWGATIRMAPLVPVRVRDGYLDGRGMMKAAVASVVTVAEGAPTPELDQGALVRYLAEAVWVPTRLLPGDGLSWSAVDETSAVVTLVDGPCSASVHVHFDGEGDVVGIYVPDRGREVEGRYVPTPWRGRFGSHRDVGGFRIPLEGEVAWVVDGEEVPYWRGRIVAVEYA